VLIAARLFGMSPLEILRLDRTEFHRLMAFAYEAERQNTRHLMRLQNRGKDDMLPAIAGAVYIGTKAAG